MEDPAPAGTLLRSRGFWLTLLLILVLCGAYHGSVVPVLATVLEGLFVVTAAGIGLLLSSASIGTMIAGGITGPLIDYIGERKVLVAGVLGLSVFLLLAAVSPSFGVYFVAAVGIAVMFNAINMAVPLYIISLYPEWKRKSFALNLVTGVVPGLFFPFLVERLLASEGIELRTVFRVPYLIVGAVCAVLFVLFAFRQRRVSGAVPRGPRELSFLSAAKHRIVPVLRNRRTWLFALLIGLHGTGDTVIYQWFPTFLTRTYENPVIGPGLTLSLFSLAYFLSRFLLVLLPDDKGRRLFVVAPGIIGGACLLLALTVPSSVAAALLYPLGAFFWSFEFPALFSEVYRELAEGFGSFQSVAFLVISGVTFVAINGIGLAVDAGASLPLLLGIVACCFPLFGIVAAISGIGKIRADGDEPAANKEE